MTHYTKCFLLLLHQRARTMNSINSSKIDFFCSRVTISRYVHESTYTIFKVSIVDIILLSNGSSFIERKIVMLYMRDVCIIILTKLGAYLMNTGTVMRGGEDRRKKQWIESRAKVEWVIVMTWHEISTDYSSCSCLENCSNLIKCEALFALQCIHRSAAAGVEKRLQPILTSMFEPI